jgi:hypothetical protein
MKNDTSITILNNRLRDTEQLSNRINDDSLKNEIKSNIYYMQTLVSDISEEYVKRPADKNGEPIKVGSLVSVDGDDSTFVVSMEINEDGKWWLYLSNGSEISNLDRVAVVVKPTVENVIEDMENRDVVSSETIDVWITMLKSAIGA